VYELQGARAPVPHLAMPLLLLLILEEGSLYDVVFQRILLSSTGRRHTVLTIERLIWPFHWYSDTVHWYCRKSPASPIPLVMDMLTVCVVTCCADDAKVEQEADQLLSAVCDVLVLFQMLTLVWAIMLIFQVEDIINYRSNKLSYLTRHRMKFIHNKLSYATRRLVQSYVLIIVKI